MIPPEISLRTKTDADLPFLCALYGTTRDRELAQVEWPPGAQEAFVRQQFEAQRTHYDTYFAGADFLVVERSGVPIGRLYVDWLGTTDVRIVDIALLPEACGKGIGSALLGDVMTRAAALGRTVSIHVEHYNPALRLYQRLGFEHVEENGVHFLMRWSGGPSGT